MSREQYYEIRRLTVENHKLRRQLAHAKIIIICSALTVVTGLFLWVAIVF